MFLKVIAMVQRYLKRQTSLFEFVAFFSSTKNFGISNTQIHNLLSYRTYIYYSCFVVYKNIHGKYKYMNVEFFSEMLYTVLPLIEDGFYGIFEILVVF